MTIAEIWQFLQANGLTGGLFLIIVTGALGWWVWGWQYQQVVKERDEAVNRLLNANAMASIAADAAAKARAEK